MLSSPSMISRVHIVLFLCGFFPVCFWLGKQFQLLPSSLISSLGQSSVNELNHNGLRASIQTLRQSPVKDELDRLRTNIQALRGLLVGLLCKESNTVLETGGWCLFPDLKSEKLDPGVPFETFHVPFHHVPADDGLAPYLQEFFGQSRVLDLGAGVGQYEIYWKTHAARLTSTPLDGALNVEDYTGGFVQWADFSYPINPKGSPFDWVMSLEVGEHIPKKFEKQFLKNLDRHNVCGIVLSWGIPGQGGHSHVNLKSNEEVISIMKDHGYVYDERSSTDGRRKAKYPWFHGSFMVFRRHPFSAYCKR